MKLAYLSQSKIPSREANSIHVMKMCQAFSRLGHTVTLVAPNVRSGTEAGIANPHAFYGVAPCFEVTKLHWPRLRGRAYVYGWHAGRLARRLGADTAFGRCLYSCAVAARLGVPTIWDAHMPTFLERRRERWIFQRMVEASAFRGVVTNCDALRREVVKTMPALEGRILAAHNGADPLPDALQPADLGPRNGRVRVGYVGHLYPGKGFEIVRAMAARAPWADFHVVGGEQVMVDALARDTTLPANIRLHGFVPPAEAERLSLAFDVLLAPYQSEVRTAGGGETAAWMSPLKLFGYMACGKPILCSDLPVLREIIEDRRNAILVLPDDPDAWTSALRRLVDNPSERARLGAAAKADFLAHHTWMQRATLVLEIHAPSSSSRGQG